MSHTSFRDLHVWQRSITLVKLVYTLTQGIPAAERFGLTAQLRKTAVSIPSNIAEGNARQNRKDCVHFLIISRGSLAELETQLVIARELQMMPDDPQIWELLREVTRMLQARINRLEQPAP